MKDHLPGRITVSLSIVFVVCYEPNYKIYGFYEVEVRKSVDKVRE